VTWKGGGSKGWGRRTIDKGELFKEIKIVPNEMHPKSLFSQYLRHKKD